MLVSSLCADIVKIEDELKLYESPKGIVQKIVIVIDELNDDVMKQNAKQLS